jgi:cytochrome c-type biogenesis protein CcmH/NrfG
VLKNLSGDKKEARRRPLQEEAHAAQSSGDLPAELRARRALAELDPSSPAAQTALAQALQRAGEEREAIAAYRKALANGAPGPSVRFQLGALHMSLAEYELAREHFDEVLVAEPGNADAMCMLGAIMNDLRRYEEAAGWFERALDRRPDFSEAHFNLGLARFERADFQGAAASFSRCAALRRGKPWSGDRMSPPGGEPEPVLAPEEMGVNEIKLRHDCEQLAYLLELGRLPNGYRKVLDDYRSLLEEIRGKVDESSLIAFDAGRHPLVARTYKRPVHVSNERPPEGPLINPQLDFRGVEDRYLAADPNVVSLDDLLTPSGLQALRRFCTESTIWNNIKPGYLGSYFYDGFCSELLLRLAWELRASLPRVVRDFPLQMMWGYKCDCTLPGLGVHADAAAVNVNFWITPDEANLAPERGGLLVYTEDAPKEWGFAKFNNDPRTILDYLESKGSVPMRVPYRANRAVIFDSDLFHATDNPLFREGYLNRRINVTLLYGGRSM